MMRAAACVLAAVFIGAPAAFAQPPAPPAGQAEPAEATDPAAAEQAADSGQPAEAVAAQAPQDQPAEAAAEPPAGEEPAAADAQQPDAADSDEQTVDPNAEVDPDAEGDADAEAPGGTFEAPAGLILSYIKTEGGSDFERVLGRLSTALQASEDEQHSALAEGWSLYRAREPGPDGEVLYVWLIDPVAAGGDYAVPALLGEFLPDESQALYDAFSAAFGAGQALINLEPVNLGAAAPQ